MDRKGQEEIALHRWAVIAEAASGRLTAAERGALVRQIAARAPTHPDGSARRYSRGTIDRWLRAWRAGGLAALKPSPRADAGTVRAHPELFAEAAALRRELPGRSAAQIASILFHRHGIRVHERTIRGQLRRAGLHREALKPSRRHTEGMRPPGPTSGGFPTFWWARGFRIRDGTGRCGPGCSSLSMTIPGCWSTGSSSPMRTPAPARTCCAGRSPAAACQRCSTATTGRPFLMRGWPAPAQCWASGWSTASPTPPP
jgi:transposase